MPLPQKVQDKRDELVKQVIKDIEEGKPFFWDDGLLMGKRPRNLTKALKGQDSFYRGVNYLQLSLSALRQRFRDSRWATFKQIQDLGYRVKKGSKGTAIEFYQDKVDAMEINPKTGKKEPVYIIDEDTGQKVKKQVRLDFPIVKTYTVFNAEQVDGIELEKIPEVKIDPKELNPDMENMIANSEAKIYFDQTVRNYYTPKSDEIHVVPKEGFISLDRFYSTVAHEIAHSTGAESRLNRETLTTPDKFGGTTYAKEELRAEITSMFLSQKYNLKFDENHYQNHAAYLKGWVKVLKNDPNELFKAAKDAEKAMAYIETRMINLQKTQDLAQTDKPDDTIDNAKLENIRKHKPTAIIFNASQMYLSMAQRLLKSNSNVWRKDFNNLIAKEMISVGKNVFDIKNAIMKHSPTKVTTKELTEMTNTLKKSQSLTR